MEKIEAMLADVRAQVEAIEASLPDGFDIAMLTLNSKIPFKALSYREALIHRFSDLSTHALQAIEVRKPVSSATLTRGCMETMARLFELKGRIERFICDTDLESIDDFLMNRLFGSRSNPSMPSATNILNCIDKIDQTIPLFRKNYDTLSEFVHPNYSGTFGTFAKIDRVNLKVKFSDEERVDNMFKVIVPSFAGTIHGFYVVYDHIGDNIETMNGILDIS
ncbi:MAG: hypothetical protein JJE34_09500 [Alphaproteobacteria bacterium]|nr:hypothetical protein [Alphaproteobacteria bacterium]